MADRKETTNPGTNPDGLFSTYRYDDVDEGTWFFHVRLRNAKGWGDVSHFKFQIDTEKPESLTIKQLDATDPTSKVLKFAFESTDKTSGIDYYQVGLDDAESQLWRDGTGASSYELPRPQAGKHTLNVRAVDKAGNYITKSFEFMVEASNAPLITDYPKRVTSGKAFTIEGQAQSSSQVIVWMQRSGSEEKPYVTTSNEDGKFSRRIEESLPVGNYMAWAQSVDSNGIKSATSEKVAITVKAPFVVTGSMMVWGAGSIFALMLAMIVTLFIWVHRLRHEVATLKRSVFGVGSVKSAVKTAAMLVRRRVPIKRKKIVTKTITEL